MKRFLSNKNIARLETIVCTLNLKEAFFDW